MSEIESVELCAGGGGQAIGLEQAGFAHSCLVEFDHNCVATLRTQPKGVECRSCGPKQWNGEKYKGADLLAAGLPCPPLFKKRESSSVQTTRENLFPDGDSHYRRSAPQCVLVENVRGIFGPRFFDDFSRKFSTAGRIHGLQKLIGGF